MSTDRFQRLRKLGIGVSLVFILNAGFHLFYVLNYGEHPRTEGYAFTFKGFSIQLSDILIFPVWVGMGLLTAYDDRKLWKAWVALFVGPALGVLANVLLLSSGEIGIATRLVRILLATYALVSFWKNTDFKRKTQPGS